MLFNSLVFIFGFLPVALLAFYAVPGTQISRKLLLTALSLFFYAWWQPRYLVLLAGTILFNWLIGRIIQRRHDEQNRPSAARWLTVGVAADVMLLGWFKYANFAVDNLNALGAAIPQLQIALPLAISFFTFQKIAYLVDSARGEAQRMSLLDFALFASFFPQLIAGPITHYKEIVPQFSAPLFGKPVWRNIMIGLVIFAIGLFKKTVIADTLSQYVDPLFSVAEHGGRYGAKTGWAAAWAFTFQIYFDFSGYSDMAIGLARMFGVRLPLNFHSPLRAANISDYWRRWHMTLQRFIVTYIFQPLTIPLSRFVAERDFPQGLGFAVSVVFPLFVTFLVVGIWHGAGWTFVAFGAMHAIYLSVHQTWTEYRHRRRRRLRKSGKASPSPSRIAIAFSHVLTLGAVLFANVMFRASTVGHAILMWRGMIFLDRPAPMVAQDMLNTGFAVCLVLAAAIVFLMPNTQQIMDRFEPALNWAEWRRVAEPLLRWRWRPSLMGVTAAAITLFLGVMFVQRGQAVFIYFKF